MKIIIKNLSTKVRDQVLLPVLKAHFNGLQAAFMRIVHHRELEYVHVS